jgi:3-deoxy-7-phosphoheptulonate synthase
MIRPTDDLRIRNVRPLIPPAILLEEIPISERASNVVTDTRAAVTRVIEGADPRLVVVVGPCSIHDTGAALEYAQRLKPIADRLADSLIVVMRTYFEKPRTAVGWKGLINDPDLDESFHINKGLRLARQLLLDVNDLGVPTGSEFLDTQIPQHIADLTSWVAIGARTAESQVHRELASGLSCPVGFKNGTDGNVGIAVDAMRAAHAPHHAVDDCDEVGVELFRRAPPAPERVLRADRAAAWAQPHHARVAQVREGVQVPAGGIAEHRRERALRYTR